MIVVEALSRHHACGGRTRHEAVRRDHRVPHRAERQPGRVPRPHPRRDRHRRAARTSPGWSSIPGRPAGGEAGAAALRRAAVGARRRPPGPGPHRAPEPPARPADPRGPPSSIPTPPSSPTPAPWSPRPPERLGGIGFFLRADRTIWAFADGEPLLMRRAEHWTTFPLELAAAITNATGGHPGHRRHSRPGRVHHLRPAARRHPGHRRRSRFPRGDRLPEGPLRPAQLRRPHWP